MIEIYTLSLSNLQPDIKIYLIINFIVNFLKLKLLI